MNDPTILDEAFKIAQDAYEASSHADAKEQLHKQHPELSSGDIAAIYDRACSLAYACCDVGEELVCHWKREPEMFASMKAQFPGFSDETYHFALNWGAFRAT